MKRHALFAIFLLALIYGCAGPGVKHTDRDPAVMQCLDFYEQADALVEQAGVVDVEAVPVGGFPYLRTDRSLAKAGQAPLTRTQFEAWVDRMARLDREARAIEYRNLPADKRRQLAPSAEDMDAKLTLCEAAMRRHDRWGPEDRIALSKAADVPPSYSTAQRVFGLYPLTSAFLSGGIGRLHRQIEADYQQPTSEIPVRGQLVRYTSPSSHGSLTQSQVAAVLERASDNPLGMPEPAAQDAALLFQTFAPTWEVDTVTRDDRIGAPYWRDGEVAIDVERPTVYVRLSHAHFHEQYLLQLNYVVWFPARTKRGSFDLLAGKLDGLTWRVTLAPDGEPIAYDTIHNCGCYHMFFPTQRLEPIPGADEYGEPLLIPQRLPLDRGGRLTVRVSAGDHYVQRVHFAADEGTKQYEKRAYEELRSLPWTDEQGRSLFGPNGLVVGSERGERWLLWPSGVKSPGAMRQWGHHAVAFLGRRHFDDPDLLERYFRPADAELTTKPVAGESLLTDADRSLRHPRIRDRSSIQSAGRNGTSRRDTP